MRLKLLLSLALATFSLPPSLRATPPPVGDTAAGRLISLSYPSVALNTQKLLKVYTPPGYFDAGNLSRYPVLYWLYPSFTSSSTPERLLLRLPGNAVTPEGRLDALIHSGSVPPMLVVYLDLDIGAFYSEKFLTEEVLPFIDASFRTKARSSGRGIEGTADRTLDVALPNPDVYASISMLGATPWNGWVEAAPTILRDGAQFYLSVGDADPNYANTVALANELTGLGIPYTLDVVPGVGNSLLDLYAARGLTLLQWHAARFADASVLDAGTDQDLDQVPPVATELTGTLLDPELILGPNPTFLWSQLSGPAAATLASPGTLTTPVSLPAFGVYHFQLEAQGLTTIRDVVKVRLLDLDTGIVLELPLDQNTLDTSGQGHHGSTAGDPVFDAAGRKGAALAFDGVDDVLTVPDFSYGPAYSLSLWLKPADLSGSAYQYLFSHNGFDVAPSCNLYLPELSATWQGSEEGALGMTARMRLVLRDSVGDLSSQGLTAETSNLGNGLWHHAALVVEPGLGHRLYYDGNLVLSGENGGDAFNPSTPLTFATRSLSPAGRYFEGSLDEIRLYDRALVVDEVQQLVAPPVVNTAPQVSAGDNQTLYLSPLVLQGQVTESTPTGVLNITWSQVAGPDTVTFSNPTLPLTSVIFPRRGTYVLRLTASDGELTSTDEMTATVIAENTPGLVAQWTLDTIVPSIPNNSFHDSSGLGHSGFLFDGFTLLSPGRIGDGALRFDRATGGAAWIENSPFLSFAPSKSYSVSAWVRLAPGKTGTIISKGWVDPATRPMHLQVIDIEEDGRVDLHAIVGGSENNQAAGLGPRLDDDSWHLVTLVHDASSASNQLYIDGEPMGLPAASGAASGTAQLMLAKVGGSSETLDGDLDDVRVYSRALSAVEVMLLFTGPTIPPCGPPTCLFGDGFELGNTSAWSGSN